MSKTGCEKCRKMSKKEEIMFEFGFDSVIL